MQSVNINVFFSLDFESAIQAGYTPSPTFELIESVADYKSLIEPIVADVHRHTKPLCFRFLKHESGYAVMHYRHRSTDKWLPDKKDELLRLLTVSVTMHLCTVVIYKFY